MIRQFLLVAACVLAGCYSDPCLEAHTQRVVSPSGERYADLFSGPCPGAAPQILVAFERGNGGGGVFAVNDSATALSARWLSEDSLEVTYPVTASVAKKETVTQYRQGRVHVVYRQTAAP